MRVVVNYFYNIHINICILLESTLTSNPITLTVLPTSMIIYINKCIIYRIEYRINKRHIRERQPPKRHRVRGVHDAPERDRRLRGVRLRHAGHHRRLRRRLQRTRVHEL